MEEQFRALLTGHSSVTALVASTSINWGAHPQKRAWPGVVLNVISNASGLHLTGTTGFWQGRVQVDCYAETYTGAKTIARAIVARLHGYAGANFAPIEHVGTRDSREGGVASNVADRPYRCSLDFITNWRA